jgi:hypothetical protein
MELSPEAKAAAELKAKDVLKGAVDLVDIVIGDVAKQSANKVDDVIVPIIEPMAKEALYKIIDGIKL